MPRRPKPPNLIALEGRRSHHAARPVNIVAPLGDAPDVVQGDAEAMAEWTRITEAMPVGHFADGDAAVMGVHCLSWSLLVAARRELKREGLTVLGSQGQQRPHPCISIMRTQAKHLQTTANLLALDPTSRGRFALIAAVPDAADGDDDLDRLLRG